jgi:RimJ/RimL family protein N-acetyltransferase
LPSAAGKFLRRFGLENLAVRCPSRVSTQGLAVESLGSEAEVTRAAVACLHLHYVPDNTGLPNAFNSGMDLTTSRLLLRPWRDADLSAFARLNDDPTVMEFLARRLSRDESDATAARIRTAIEKRSWGFWAVEVKGPGPAAAPFIGFVGLSVPSFEAHFTPCVEIGWRLAKEHWGCGYASEAAAASLRFAFENLKLQQIIAFTVPLNKRSIRVMERIGMSRDLAGDFEHPKLPPGHPLRPHVLYRVSRTEWLNREA